MWQQNIFHEYLVLIPILKQLQRRKILPKEKFKENMKGENNSLFSVREFNGNFQQVQETEELKKMKNS